MHILRRKNKSLGFTLLELLVVISIIGILIAISAAAFTTAQQKARNAKRQGDINAMAKAFEQYNSTNNGNYHLTTTNCTGMTASLPGNVLPRDPKTNVPYSCVNTSTTYCACAQLEPTGNTNGNATNDSCADIGTSGSFYCAVNQQ